MTLVEAEMWLHKFIQANWSDQKLAEVKAFNDDGMMSFHSACGCVLGVTLSGTLHRPETCPDRQPGSPNYSKPRMHHYNLSVDLPFAVEAEKAYKRIGWEPEGDLDKEPFQVTLVGVLRQQRLAAILQKEIECREQVRIAEQTAEALVEEMLCASELQAVR